MCTLGATITGVLTSAAATVASLDAQSGPINTTGTLNAGASTLGATSTGALSSGATTVTSLDAQGGTIETTGTLSAGVSTLGATSTGALTSAAATVASLDAQSGAIRTTGTLNAGASTLGTTTTGNLSSAAATVESLDAKTGAIKTTGTLDAGVSTLGATSTGTLTSAAANVASLDAGAGTIKTTGRFEAGNCTLGATTVASLDAGTGAIRTTGPLSSGAAAATSLSASTTLSVRGQSSMGGDLVFDAAVSRMIKFRSSANVGSDYGSLAYISNDVTANNPWGNFANAENSVLEMKVGDNANVPQYADSIRIDGAYGVLLKATEVKVQGRTNNSAKFEVLGTLSSAAATVTSLDAKSGAITTTGTLSAGSSTLGATTTGTLTSAAATVASLDAGAGSVKTTGTLSAGVSTLGATTTGNLSSAAAVVTSLDAGAGLIKTTGTLNAGASTLGATSTGNLSSAAAAVTSLDAGAGAIRTTGTLNAGVSTLGATTTGSLTSAAAVVTSLDAGAGNVKTTGTLSAGISTLGATTTGTLTSAAANVASLDAGAGFIETTGTLATGAATVASLDAQSGTIRTTGTLEAGNCTLGATNVASLDAGTGAITTTGPLSSGAAAATSLSASTTLSVKGQSTMGGDMVFDPAISRMIKFQSSSNPGSDVGSLAYISNDDTDENPWANNVSAENSVLEMKVGNDVGVLQHADSIRIDGAYGVLLKATEVKVQGRTNNSAKFEVFGTLSSAAATVTSLDANAGAIRTTGTLNAGASTLGATTTGNLTSAVAVVRSLDAGTGVIKTTGTLTAGASTLGATTTSTLTSAATAVTSLNAGAGAITTTGALSAGISTLAATTVASLDAGSGLITTSGPMTVGNVSLIGTALYVAGKTVLGMTTVSAPNTRVRGGGVAESMLITGSSVRETGVWGTYDKILEGGDLVLTAGDGESYGNNGSAKSTIRGGDVYLRAGRASNDSNSAGNEPRTYAGALVFQSGLSTTKNNLDKNAYITAMRIQNGKVGMGVDDLYAKPETLQVSGGILEAGGGITTAGSAVVGGDVRTGTLTVAGATTTSGNLRFSSHDSRIDFAGVSDSATIQFLKDDDSAANPWGNAASSQNSSLVISVGDDSDAIHGDSIRLDASRGIVLRAQDRVISTCQIEAQGGLNALDKTISTSGTVQAGSRPRARSMQGATTTGPLTSGAAVVTSLDAKTGAIKTTGSMEAGVLAVAGDVQAGQIYVRSYNNLTLETAADSYTEICSISTTHGARTVHVDLVQSTADGSHSMTYVLAEQHEDAQSYWECLPTATSGPWRDQERISLEVYTFNATSVFAMKRVKGTHPADIVAVVKVVSVTAPQITQLFGKGTRAAYTEIHPCAQLTQINGTVGVGIRDPAAKLHVDGGAIVTGGLTTGSMNASGLATMAGGLVADGGSMVDGVYTRVYDLELSAASKAYTDVCTVAGANGARTLLIDIVQAVSSCSLSRTFVVATRASGGTYSCLPASSSGPWETNDIGLELEQGGSSSEESRLYITRIGGQITSGIRVCVRATSSAPLTFTPGTASGVLPSLSSQVHFSTRAQNEPGLFTKTFTDLSLATNTGSYTEICQIVTFAGARVVTIDLVQSVDGSSHSSTFVIAESFQGASQNYKRECLPIATSGPYGEERVGLEVETTESTSKFAIKRRGGTRTGSFVAVVKVSGAPGASITPLTGKGTRADFTSTHSCTQVTQINGNVGIGTRDPTAKLHVAGATTVDSLYSEGDITSASDAQLKFDVTDIQGALEKARALRGVLFRRHTDPEQASSWVDRARGRAGRP